MKLRDPGGIVSDGELLLDDMDCIDAPAADVLAWLRACSAHDMGALPYRRPDGSSVDAWFGVAAWSARALGAYMRAKVRDAALDAWFVRLATYHGDMLRIGLEQVFPRRAAGDYSVRGRDAQTGAMMPRAYVQSSRPISVLSQWWNNRKGMAALFVGLAGVWLGQPALAAEAMRYVREWLTYSVTGEGWQGEWSRNGAYGYAAQGLTYGATNIAVALALAEEMRKAGDPSLAGFATTDGLYGTQSVTPKTLLLPAQLHIAALLGGAMPLSDAGAVLDATLGPAGTPMHATWYLPPLRAWGHGAALAAWAAKPRTRLDATFGLWRGVAGIWPDVRS